MKLEPGMLARSKAGHDKDRIYVIIRTEDEFVYVADGDLRPLRHMKRKNARHLQPVLKMRLEGERCGCPQSDKEIYPTGGPGLGTGAGRL